LIPGPFRCTATFLHPTQTPSLVSSIHCREARSILLHNPSSFGFSLPTGSSYFSILDSSMADHFMKSSSYDQLSYSLSSGNSNTSFPKSIFALSMSMRIFSVFDFLLDHFRKSTLIMMMIKGEVTVLWNQRVLTDRTSPYKILYIVVQENNQF
jgi:hypothetical protein